MDFANVVRLIAAYLEGANQRFALVGGHGLAAFGLVRATLDLDFVVERQAQAGLVAFMEREGYETLHRSSGYSNHLHSDSDKGRVDFIYVGEGTAEKVFLEAQRVTGPGGVEVSVPCPEHLIAMKVQALKNDPERRFQEMSDIAFLLRLPGVDPKEVKSYFEKLGLGDAFDELG